tara:strand:- start:766 stop:969 length:204 start_codon:yes stop_codon:yes gene_type:complete
MKTADPKIVIWLGVTLVLMKSRVRYIEKNLLVWPQMVCDAADGELELVWQIFRSCEIFIENLVARNE